MPSHSQCDSTFPNRVTHHLVLPELKNDISAVDFFEIFLCNYRKSCHESKMKFIIYDNEETKFYDVNDINDHIDCTKEVSELIMNSYSNTIYINDNPKTEWFYDPNSPYEWEFSADIFLSNLKKDLPLLDYFNNHKNDIIWLHTIVLPNINHVDYIDSDSDSDDDKD